MGRLDWEDEVRLVGSVGTMSKGGVQIVGSYRNLRRYRSPSTGVELAILCTVRRMADDRWSLFLT